MEYQEEIDFLKSKGILTGNKTEYLVQSNSEFIDLVKLLNEYAQWYQYEHDQGEMGRY